MSTYRPYKLMGVDPILEGRVTHGHKVFEFGPVGYGIARTHAVATTQGTVSQQILGIRFHLLRCAAAQQLVGNVSRQADAVAELLLGFLQYPYRKDR